LVFASNLPAFLVFFEKLNHNLTTKNKKKIINDPIYGFIHIPSDLAFDILDHPFFQRLRRIKQLGLTHLVYPGAMHTRFQHALGAMHLMIKALEHLQAKTGKISQEEKEAAIIAILLHDIGHGPFSHALENSIIPQVNHEQLSILFMQALNREFNGKLNLAIDIFKGTYPKSFLHQLVSGQLDVDRLDYLKRDSFYTGVSEGVVGSDRIINMLNISNDQLVVEEKGIISIEKFLFARRFMYWQVYLHKTVVSAESLLLLALKRAKKLTADGHQLPAGTALSFFLKHNVTLSDLQSTQPAIGNRSVLELFAELDDNDIVSALKEWRYSQDRILSFLAAGILDRKLFRIEIHAEAILPDYLASKKNDILKKHGFKEEELDYLIYNDSITNLAYSLDDSQISILFQNSVTADIFECSDILHPHQLSKGNKKYFLVYPR
jgi:uncharacterized protein